MNLKGLFKSNRKRFSLIIVLLFLVAVANTMSGYLYKPAADYLLKNNLKNTLYYFFIMVLMGVLSVVFEAIVQTMYSKQVQEYIGSLRQKIVAHFYAQGGKSVAEMQNDLSNNLDMLTDNYAMPLQTIIGNSFSLIMIIGVLFQLNWSLLVLTVVLAVINLLTPKIMEKATIKANEQISIENSKLLKAIDYWMGGMKELRRYSSFLALFKAMGNADQSFEDSNIQSAKTMSLSVFISDFTNVASQTLLGIWAGILFFQGNLSIGATLVAASFASQIFNALFVYEQAIIQFKSIKAVNDQIKKLEQSVPKSNEKSDPDLAELEIKDLSVKYDQGEEISYPDIQVKRGEKILLSGDSGTGKSTLFKVILGQMKPKTGKILFKNSKGHPIKPDLSKIGYIAQKPRLFPATIAENITMFNSKLDDQIDQMVEEVDLRKDIQKFKKGVDQEINLDRLNVSGGQRQKIVLARAKIHDSNIILIDEGTSAIDQNATISILKDLLKSKATIVFIAHNFSEKMQSMFDREIKLQK